MYFLLWDPKDPVGLSQTSARCKFPDKMSLDLWLQLHAELCLPTWWVICIKDKVMQLANQEGWLPIWNTVENAEPNLCSIPS